MLSHEEIEKGITTALETKENAFAFKSHHNIGACTITEDGSFFGGCNVENPISGLGKCAEQCSIIHAVIHGKYTIKGIVVASQEKVVPCGECLEFLATFSQIKDRDIEIILADQNRVYEISSLYTLLPRPYLTHDMVDSIKSFKNR